MEFRIPGIGTISINNIILDYNGTIAVDGIMIPGVEELLNELSADYSIHVITADTFGSAEAALRNVNCRFTRISPDNQSMQKLQYLAECGKETSACIGNGKNDRYMLKESAIGIALIQREGLFAETALAADILCPDIFSALEFFKNPERLIATMRD